MLGGSWSQYNIHQNLISARHLKWLAVIQLPPRPRHNRLVFCLTFQPEFLFNQQSACCDWPSVT